MPLFRYQHKSADHFSSGCKTVKTRNFHMIFTWHLCDGDTPWEASAKHREHLTNSAPQPMALSDTRDYNRAIARGSWPRGGTAQGGEVHRAPETNSKSLWESMVGSDDSFYLWGPKFWAYFPGANYLAVSFREGFLVHPWNFAFNA